MGIASAERDGGLRVNVPARSPNDGLQRLVIPSRLSGREGFPDSPSSGRKFPEIPRWEGESAAKTASGSTSDPVHLRPESVCKVDCAATRISGSR